MSGSMAPLFLYQNNGDGTFSLMSTNLPGAGRGSMSAGDFDHDGRADLLVNGCPGYCSGNDQPFLLRVLRNLGDWNFSTLYSAQNAGASAMWADFDGDGDLDIAYGGNGRLLRNNLSMPHAPPVSPSALTSTLTSDGITFSWMLPTNAVTGALRIGSVPGGNDVLTSDSSAVTGLRRVAAPGYALQKWKLRAPIVPGNYYWSVQTIDAGWVGSAFAPEAVVHVPNFPPVALPNSITMAEDTVGFAWIFMSDFNGQPLTFSIVTPPTNGTLTLDTQWVWYQPKTNFFGVDSFLFQAYDGITNSEPARVTIQVTNVPDVPVTRLGLTLTTGQLQLAIRGEPYQRYAIDVSEDLLAWTQVTLVQLSSAGTGMFAPSMDAGARRFYRTRVIP
jgi:hypothetical protein